jgi:hypothetical protein
MTSNITARIAHGFELWRKAMLDQDEKVREDRVRWEAECKGFTLQKSRRRDPRAYEYRVYWLVDSNNTIVTSESGMSLIEIQTRLMGGEDA